MRKILIYAIIMQFLCTTAFGQTTGKVVSANAMLGTDYKKNYIINSNFDKNISGVTTVGAATVSHYTASPLRGAGSLRADTGSFQGDGFRIPISAIDPIDYDRNCELHVVSKGTITTGTSGAGNWFIENSSNVELPGYVTTIAGANSTREYVITTPCNNIGALGGFAKWTSNTTDDVLIDVDEAYFGAVTNIGTGVPNSFFAARISSTGVVSDETGGNWLNGNCTNANPRVCTFTTGQFAIAPICTVTPFNSSADSVAWEFAAATTTGISWFTAIAQSGTGTQMDIKVHCSKAGSDAVQATITPQNFDYGPTAFTPTLGAGFGTTSNVSFFHSRKNNILSIYGTFTATTTTAGIGSVSIPSSLAIDSTKVPINNTTANAGGVVGSWGSGVSTGYFGNIVTATGTSTSLVYITSNIGGTSELTPTAAVSSNAINGTGVVSIKFEVPIQGWDVTQGAPQLVGSVTSNEPGALRIEAARVNCLGSSTIISQTGSLISTIGNISSGVCSIVFASGFSSTPLCVATRNNNADVTWGIIPTSATAATLDCKVGSTGAACGGGGDANITCIGAR